MWQNSLLQFTSDRLQLAHHITNTYRTRRFTRANAAIFSTNSSHVAGTTKLIDYFDHMITGDAVDVVTSEILVIRPSGNDAM